MSYDRTDKRQNRDYYYFKNDCIVYKKFILKFYSLNKDTTPPPNTLYYCRFLEFKWDRIKTGREIYWLNRNRPKDSLSE